MKRKNKIYRGTYGLFLGFKVSLNIWLKWAKERFAEGRMVYFRNNGYRHRRSVISRHEVRLFGKHLHPIWTVYTRAAKPIGRQKHGKWLYTPKRIVVFEERWD